MNGRQKDALALLVAIVAAGVGLVLALAICTRPPGPAADPTPTTPPVSSSPTPAPGATQVPAATPTAVPTRSPLPLPSPDPAAQAAGAWTPPHATQLDHCLYQHAGDGAFLPDPYCTTGATNPGLDTAKLCAPDFRTGPYRNVPQAEKDAVYAAYGVSGHHAGAFEVDHLVSLELGGANDQTNLWPQPADPRPGFHEKDQVENYLHQQVCAGALTLADAQRRIATDWTQFLGLPGVATQAPKVHVGDVEAD